MFVFHQCNNLWFKECDLVDLAKPKHNFAVACFCECGRMVQFALRYSKKHCDGTVYSLKEPPQFSPFLIMTNTQCPFLNVEMFVYDFFCGPCHESVFQVEQRENQMKTPLTSNGPWRQTEKALDLISHQDPSK